MQLSRFYFRFQEYDAGQFDAFCICLECESGGSGHSRSYLALCEWLVELSLELIRPKLPSSIQPDTCLSINTTGRSRAPRFHLRLEDRLHFFLKRLSKARIWDNDSGILFKRLQTKVESFMEDIAVLCDERLVAFDSFCEANLFFENLPVWQTGRDQIGAGW